MGVLIVSPGSAAEIAAAKREIRARIRRIEDSILYATARCCEKDQNV
jgi:hypothetical protein